MTDNFNDKKINYLIVKQIKDRREKRQDAEYKNI